LEGNSLLYKYIQKHQRQGVMLVLVIYISPQLSRVDVRRLEGR
jgi:hypothetical protein